MSQWRSDARSEYDGWAEPGSLMARLRRSYISREVFPIRPAVLASLLSSHNIKDCPFKVRFVTCFFHISVSVTVTATDFRKTVRLTQPLAKMKVTLLAAGLVATVFAQDLSSIPECARTCLTDAISKDGQCQATDAACVCGRIDQLTTLATSCVLSACGQDVALSMRNLTRPDAFVV